MRTYRAKNSEEDASHAISSLGERLDDKLPILLTPSPYLRIRIDDRCDVISDVFLLSTLAMKGHAERCQKLEGTLYVDLRSARDANVQIWDAQANKILDKIEDLFSWGWHAGTVRTLIKCVHDEITSDLKWK
jgi:hypothetical protein